MKPAFRSRAALPMTGAVALCAALAACSPAGPPMPAGAASIFDGTYSGMATPTDRALPGCNNAFPATMTVSGGHYKLDYFEGQVLQDGKVQAFFRRDVLDGQFVSPGVFEGRVDNYQNMVCAHTVRLVRQ